MSQRPPDPWVRQSSVWHCVETMAAGDVVSHPIAVELHLGTACNLACPECISRSTLNTASFSTDRALAVAAELAATGIRCVVLSGGGEPLLHPAAGQVMESLHHAGISLALVTNGTLLHNHLEEVVASASRVRVSVDAATPETYARFRPMRGGGNAFPQLLTNLTAIAPRMRERLTFSFVVLTRPNGHASELNSNVSDLAEAARLARSIGCTTFEVNVGFDHRLQPDPAHALISDRLAGQLNAAMQLAGPDFRVFADPIIVGIAAGRGIGELPDRSYSRCPAAHIRALVSPQGVFLCPRHQGLARASYGDPRTTPLRELWGSPAFRAALEAVDPRVDCQGACMSMQLNERLLTAIDWLRAGGSPPRLAADDDLFM